VHEGSYEAAECFNAFIAFVVKNCGFDIEVVNGFSQKVGILPFGALSLAALDSFFVVVDENFKGNPFCDLFLVEFLLLRFEVESLFFDSVDRHVVE
jgi:hypothetical protein